MPTSTYIPLSTLTLSSGDSSVTFSSIPGTYKDLVLVVNGSAASSAGANIRFNNDSGANYSVVFMFSQGNGTYSESYTSQDAIGIGAFQNSGLNVHHIIDYSSTDKHKTVIIKRDTPTYTTTGIGRWSSTAAITSVTFNSSQNMLAGTTLSLYGIAG